eukprot:212660_1
MGKQHSSLWWVFGAEFAAVSVIYHCIFWKTFTYFQKNKAKTPKECLFISSNIISSIHVILVTLPSIFDFLHYKRWQNPIVDEPKLAGYIWPIVNSFLFVDLIAHLTCYAVYGKKTIPPRYDMIIHHLACMLFYILIQIPNPVYIWGIFSLVMASEISTIFLNLQWFGKAFKNKKLEKISQRLFITAWMLIRVPIFLYITYFIIKYQKRAKDKMCNRAYIAGYMLTVPGIGLQIIWTIFIIWKICFHILGNDHKSKIIKSPRHVHGISMSIINHT